MGPSGYELACLGCMQGPGGTEVAPTPGLPVTALSRRLCCRSVLVVNWLPWGSPLGGWSLPRPSFLLETRAWWSAGFLVARPTFVQPFMAFGRCATPTPQGVACVADRHQRLFAGHRHAQKNPPSGYCPPRLGLELVQICKD